MQKLGSKLHFVWVCIGILTLHVPLYGQVLSGDANGKSTILFEGGNISFNLQEKAFDVAYNHFQDYRFSKKLDSATIVKLFNQQDFTMPNLKRRVWGISARGKAANGLALVFAGGNLASQGNIGGYMGWSKLGNYTKEVEQTISKTEKERNKSALLAQGLKEAYFRALEEKGEKWIKEKIKTADTLRLKNTLIEVLGRNMPKDISLAFQARKLNSDQGDAVFINFNGFMAFEAEKAYQTDYLKNIAPLEAKFTEAVESLGKMRNYWTKRSTFYINGGIEGIGFKLMGAFDSTNASKSYSDKAFTGFFANVGYNWHYGEDKHPFLGKNAIIGINGGIANTSNFGSLQAATLTVKKVDIDKMKQELISEKKVDVYSGFETYYQLSLNFDVVKMYKIEDKYTIATTYYGRHNAPLTKGIKTVTTTDLGVSSYFFKDDGVFMGGLYVQFPDVFDNNKLNRKNQASQSISQRWMFGIVSKINIVTLFGY